MKRYQLFGEHNGISIYGETVTDALLHAGEIPTGGKMVGREYQSGPPLFITKILGEEDVTQSQRGDRDFRRVVIEDKEGIRSSIDVEVFPELQKVR
jgi:hypothetical protein